MKRLRGVKGIPDFLLTFNAAPQISIFVELKHENTNIHLLQANCLDELDRMGCPAALLTYTRDKDWAIYFPPFLDKMKNIRSLKNPCIRVEELSAETLLSRGRTDGCLTGTEMTKARNRRNRM